jgi:cyclophilin family peptidyl-prolyl cis-trans isomerase
MPRASKVHSIIAVVIVAAAALLLAGGCGGGTTSSTTTATDAYTSTDSSTTGDGAVTSTAPGGESASSSTTKGTDQMSEANPVVVLHTSKGDITLELDAAKAPISAQNFVDYAKAGFYDGTVFHRVISGFMVQAGGMTPDLQPKSGGRPPIKNEAGNGLKNQRGTVAMARTQVVDSASSQFFINVVDNAALNHRDDSLSGFGYAVFGTVTEGMDVVDAIAAVPTGSQGQYQDVPVEPVVITSVTVQ